MKIAGKTIGSATAPYIIAELSGNHGQDLSVARKMIVEAARAGVDAIKLQTYTPDTITLNSMRKEFQIDENSSLWKGENLYSLYGKAYTPWEWHEELFALAKEQGIAAFSSPFDESSVEFLESLNVPCYKIASFELNHFPLLRTVAKTGKPVIMSIGMSTFEQVKASVDYLKANGCTQLALLKCTSAYPAPVDDANLATIGDLKEKFSLPVGLSDHTTGIGASIVAAALGADIIERHFVLDRQSTAVDAAFSSTPSDFKNLVEETRAIRSVIGEVHYGPAESEQDSLKYRRSIYVCRDLPEGHQLSASDIKVVRPGLGMHPKHYDSILGKTLSVAKSENTPLSLDDLV